MASPTNGDSNGAAGGDLLSAALALIADGTPVFPLRARSKVPWAGTNGFKDATVDPELVRGWWSGRPGSNVGVPLGTVSGLVVVDVDPRNGGIETWRDLLGGRKLPATRTILTSGPDNGCQFVYRIPDGVKVKTRQLGSGVELRAEGAYTLWPPSVHPDSGRARRFVVETIPVAPMPELLLELKKTATKKTEPLPAVIRDGSWHTTMVSAAGRMRRHDFAETAAVAALIAENVKYDGKHPSDNDEIAALVHDIYERYEPGKAEPDNVVQVSFPKTPVHEDEVDGAELLDEVVAHLNRFMVMSDAQADVVALFTVMTHAIEAFDVVPYLRVVSPTKKTGKSRLLELLEFTVHRPVKTGGISEAALFRSLAEGAVCLLFDEVGKLLGESSRDRNSDVAAVLLNGFTRGTPVLRCVGEGTRQVVTPFEVFGPKVLGGTGKLEDAILDRCIVVALKRKSRAEQVARLRRRDANEIATPLRARMAAWAAAHLDELSRARPDLPYELDDRAQDIVECLLAIADAAGGGWSHRARRAVVELRGGDVADDDIGVELLADIKKIFDADPGLERIPTDELILGICKDKERPWATYYRGDPMTPRQVAGLLRDFSILSHTTRFSDGAQAKGYKHGQLKDAFERYLPPSSPEAGLSVTSVPSGLQSQLSVPAGTHEQSDVTDGTDKPPSGGEGLE